MTPAQFRALHWSIWFFGLTQMVFDLGLAMVLLSK